MNVNTTDATTGATADATVGNGYCPLRIHTPYINYMTPYLTPYETRSMRVVVTKSVETSGGGHLGHVFITCLGARRRNNLVQLGSVPV